ncbi:hypothetical protein PAMP_003908 [Pampus punctatissimus]
MSDNDRGYCERESRSASKSSQAQGAAHLLVPNAPSIPTLNLGLDPGPIPTVTHADTIAAVLAVQWRASALKLQPVILVEVGGPSGPRCCLCDYDCGRLINVILFQKEISITKLQSDLQVSVQITVLLSLSE